MHPASKWLEEPLVVATFNRKTLQPALVPGVKKDAARPGKMGRKVIGQFVGLRRSCRRLQTAGIVAQPIPHFLGFEKFSNDRHLLGIEHDTIMTASRPAIREVTRVEPGFESGVINLRFP